jgi:LCP family protein required for cell wall assembly
MTDSDGTPSGELGADAETSAPSDRSRTFADAPDQPYIPGPRPGYYPEPPVSSSARFGRAGARRRPPPPLAQQRLMEQIAATRRARQRRSLLVICGAMSVLVLLAAASAWGVTSYINDNLGRVSAGTTGTPSSGPVNILVAGIDVRGGMTRRQQAVLHVGHAVSDNSDVLMVAHVAADHRDVQVVSIPRDSWVNIPGHGMNKINAAFGLGGPALMVRTVEDQTGLKINDYVEVNFLGFVKVVDALGGVDVCLPYAVDDTYSGLHLSAGVHHVGGIRALEFVRDRHSFALSDLTRISDQQQLLSSLLSEAISAGTLANPLKLQRLLSAVSGAVTVDRGFNVVSLADDLRGITPNEVSFATVPLSNLNYITPGGASAVLWNTAAARRLFAQIREDQPPLKKQHAATHNSATRSSPRPGQVEVDVYNGTEVAGLSASTGTKLAKLGFRVQQADLNWPRQNVARTVIEYPAGHRASAVLLRRVLPGSALRQVNSLTEERIVLGVTGHTVTKPKPAPAPMPSNTVINPSKVQVRTAAQDACR